VQEEVTFLRKVVALELKEQVAAEVVISNQWLRRLHKLKSC